MKNNKNTTTANITISTTINGNVTVNVTNSGSETTANTPLVTKESFSITENTTLGELLKLLNLGEKPHEIPTPKKLRENAGKPIAFYPVSESASVENVKCTVYSNGFAVYDNGSGRTVIWLPDCTSFTYVFTRPKSSEDGKIPYKKQISDEMLESLSWFMAVMLIGDHRVENNLMNRKSSRKGAKDYDTDDYGDKCGEAEEAVEEEYRDEFFWNEGRFGENPLDALIRKERDAAILAVMTDKQREVFLLYYKEGYTQQQIADMLGVDQTSVRDRLDGVLKKIKKIKIF